MEKNGILNWRKWSVIRKVQVGLVMAVMLATFGIMLLSVIIPGNGQPMGPLVSFAVLAQTPTMVILQASHSHFVEYLGNPPSNEKTILWFCVVTCINTIMMLIVVILLSLLGWLIGLATKQKNEFSDK
jgi:hypothetical protein